jgi:hypothetical protein
MVMIVVTLIGSSKQRATFDLVNEKLTRLGYLVFSLGVWDAPDKEAIRSLLESVHKGKMRLSDCIAVIHKEDGSIGEHAQEELEYAKKLGKAILHYNSVGEWCGVG